MTLMSDSEIGMLHLCREHDWFTFVGNMVELGQIMGSSGVNDDDITARRHVALKCLKPPQ